MAKIGAHVSAAISLDLSLDRAQKIGAECTQIFISPPQQWVQISHSQEETEKYRKRQSETEIRPNFIHGAYLLNLASANPETLKKSIDWLIYSQDLAEKLEISGTIFHVGSSGVMDRGEALKQVINAIQEVLTSQPRKTSSCEAKLILETSAGGGNTIGDQFTELGAIIKKVRDPRVTVCLDTQHVFASGYDIRTKEGLDRVVEEFDNKIGLSKLVAVHANDSKTELGSHHDRHENVGEGFIGKEAFANILNHPAFSNLPFIIETPGFANTGPDEQNINLLKTLRIQALSLRG